MRIQFLQLCAEARRLGRDERVPRFGYVEPGDVTKWVSGFDPDWFHGIVPDCGPLNMKLDSCSKKMF